MNVIADAAFVIGLFVVGVVFAAMVDALAAKCFDKTPVPVLLSTLLSRLREPDPGHRRVDKVLFYAAAPVALTAVMIGMIALTVDSRSATLPGPQLHVGVFFYLVVLDIMAVALFMAGWGSNQEQGVEGAFIAGAQLVSYVVPLGFSVTGAIMAAQSLSTADIVNAQHGLLFGIWQPFGFVIYLLAAMGQTYRPPVNLPVAGGKSDVLIEYRGAEDALMRLALYGIWFAAAAMGTVLFLGGWKGPLLPGVVWFFVKVGAVLALMAYLERRLRPMGVHRMLRFAWLVLIPASIINVIIVGLILMVTK